jgi:hypothetical protein
MLNYYLSPTGTGDGLTSGNPGSLATIRSLIQGNPGTDHITIWCKGGRYQLPATQVLTAADSGKNGKWVIWRPVVGDTTPIFSGGIPLTGWTLHDAPKNIWKATVPTGFNFRQLYVDGQLATRSQPLDFDGYQYTFTKNDVTKKIIMEKYEGTNLPIFSRPQDLEVMLAWWPWNLSMIHGKTQSGNNITLTDIAHELDRVLIIEPGAIPWPSTPLGLENAYEFLSASTPGMWYLNRGNDTVYYVPRAGEDMATVEVLMPNLENLFLKEEGSLFVNNIFFGLSFQHSTWTRHSDEEYMYEGQANNYQFAHTWEGEEGPYEPKADAYAPDAVMMSHGENVFFYQCEFTNLGACGLHLGRGIKHSRVAGSHFHDFAGNGLHLGLMLYPWGQVDVSLRTTHNEVDNNLVERVAQIYTGGVGIIGSRHIEDLDTHHNECRWLSYSGISMGWGWNQFLKHPRINTHHNLIHDIMLNHRDGAAFYMLSNLSESYYRYNYSYNVGLQSNSSSIPAAYSSHSFYCDHGSNGITCTNNVFFPNQYGGGRYWAYVKNQWDATYNEPITVKYNYHSHLVASMFYESGSTHISPNYAIDVSAPASWPAEVNEIIANARRQVISASEIIEGEALIFGWREEGQTVTITTTDGTVADYEEPTPIMWRARITGITEPGLLVTADSGTLEDSVTIGAFAFPPPVTACDRESGEYPGNTLITLSVVSAENPPTTIFYRWGVGEWLTYSAPFILQEATLEWYGQDDEATAEAVQSRAYTLETVPPVTGCDRAAGTYPHGTLITLSEVGTDPSQPVVIYYRWGTSGNFSVYSGPLTLTTSATLQFYGQDSAGNLEAVQSIAFTLAVAAPGDTPLVRVDGQPLVLCRVDGSPVTLVRI